MIAYLSGKLLTKQANTVIIDVGGIGYEVTIPLSTFYDLEETDSAVSLRIYTHVREDTLQLFGFKTARERELFLQLITVSGIGPKLGITLLSGMSANDLIGAIRTNNLARLNSVPGIGKKTAERLVIELRDKIIKLSSPELEEDFVSKQEDLPSSDTVYNDALSALVNLGYQKAIAEKALKSAVQEETANTVQALLRKSLQLLAKG